MDEDILTLMHYLSESESEKPLKVSALCSLGRLQERLTEADVARATCTELYEALEQATTWTYPEAASEDDGASNKSVTLPSPSAETYSDGNTTDDEVSYGEYPLPREARLCRERDEARADADVARAVCTELADENQGLLKMLREAEAEIERLEGTLNAVAMVLGYVPTSPMRMV